MAKAQETRFQCSCPEHRSVTFLSQKLFLETELFRNSHAPFHKEMKFQLQIGMENYEKPSRSELWKRGALYIISHFFQVLPALTYERHPMKAQLTRHFSDGPCRRADWWYITQLQIPSPSGLIKMQTVLWRSDQMLKSDLNKLITLGLWWHCTDQVGWWDRNQCLVFEAKLKVLFRKSKA